MKPLIAGMTYLALLLPFNILFAANENITITTYYPSPTGVYKILQLFPHALPAEPCQTGTITYNDASVGPSAPGYYGCNAARIWKLLGIGGTDPYWNISAWDANTINNTNSGNVVIGQRNPAPAGGIMDIRADSGNILTWCGANCNWIGGGIISDSIISKDSGGAWLSVNGSSFMVNAQSGTYLGTSLGAEMGASGQFNVLSLRGNPHPPQTIEAQIGDSDLPTAEIRLHYNSTINSFDTSMHMSLTGSPGSSQVQTLWAGKWTGENAGISEQNGGLYQVVKTTPSPYYQIGIINKSAGAFTSADMVPVLHVTGSAGGAVGIGTANPSSFKLQIAGNVGPDENNKYDLGNLTAPLAWNNFYYLSLHSPPVSDVRLKTRITPTPLGLDFVMHLRPVQFNWKKHDNGKHQGLIAQELKKVTKERNIEFAGLHRDAKNGYYALSYAEFIGPLIKAIQEQDKEIENLETQLKELEPKENL